MQVLAVDIEAGPQAGGAASRNLQVCRALLARGVDVRLLLASRSADPAAELEALPAERLVRIASWNHRYHLPRPEWRRIVEQVAWADVVYFPSYLWGAAPLAWLAVRRQRKPWIVCPAGVLPFFGRSLWAKHACQWLFGRALLRNAAALVAVSAQEGLALQRYVRSADHVVHIPNGVATTTASTDASPWPQAYLLFLGRLDPIKGPDLLLHAYARVRRDRAGVPDLVIAGDGPMRDALAATARGLGIAAHVHLAGWIDGAQKQRWLQHAAFAVIPSRRDAMTLVALEAAAAGRPLLLTRQCGFPEIAASDGGIEVEADVGDLARGLQRMLDSEPEWNAMGMRAQRLAREHYSWDAVAARYQQVFEHAVAHG